MIMPRVFAELVAAHGRARLPSRTLPARATGRRPARLAWVPAVLVLLAGCGELGKDYAGTRAVPSTPITAAAVARYAPGTPERTLLAWCAAFQRRDPAAASRFYAPAVRREAETMRQERLAGTFVFAARAARRGCRRASRAGPRPSSPASGPRGRPERQGRRELRPAGLQPRAAAGRRVDGRPWLIPGPARPAAGEAAGGLPAATGRL